MDLGEEGSGRWDRNDKVFFFFWLHWVFAAARALSGCRGWALGCAGSVAGAHVLGCSAVHGI